MGRSLTNTMINLGIQGACDEALYQVRDWQRRLFITAMWAWRRTTTGIDLVAMHRIVILPDIRPAVYPANFRCGLIVLFYFTIFKFQPFYPCFGSELVFFFLADPDPAGHLNTDLYPKSRQPIRQLRRTRIRIRTGILGRPLRMYPDSVGHPSTDPYSEDQCCGAVPFWPGSGSS